MLKKNWIVSPCPDEKKAQALAVGLGLHLPTARLLLSRGLDSPEKAIRFLNPSEFVFHDPFSLRDMDAAIGRIGKAILRHEKIMIYGDYDVDGVTATSVLYLYLRKKGADVGYYIPDRIGEGYGVNKDAIAGFAREGYTLLITVDTGITAIAETEYAISVGLETVITDHHECHGELPDAVAVINPMREDAGYCFPQLAGVGVVFKVICAYEANERGYKGQSEKCRSVYEEMLNRYGDLVAIGTVADVMPLVDENRTIVSCGLATATSTKHPGLAALMKCTMRDAGSDKKLSTTDVSFLLAPRINAAGRVDSAQKAVELFLTDSSTRGEEIAKELCALNLLRQEEENKIIRQAEAMIQASRTNRTNPKMFVLDHDGWHHGVIGIVASRITERYHLPSILITLDGDVGKGSGRSVPGVNLMDALRECKEYLIQYGGHELAAGMSIKRENVEPFRRKIAAYAAERLSHIDGESPCFIDGELCADDFTLEQAQELMRLEPFGTGNTQPLFLTRNFEVLSVYGLSGGKHTKFILQKESTKLTVVCFGRSPATFGLRTGDHIHAVFHLQVNEYKGIRSLQLLLRDFSFGDREWDEICAEEETYRRLKEEEDYFPDPTVDFFPTHEEFAAYYRRLRQLQTEEPCCLIFRTFSVFDSEMRGISELKLRIMTDVLGELGILTLNDWQARPCRVTIRINQIKNKISFDKSLLYRRLQIKAAKRNTVGLHTDGNDQTI